MVVLIVENVSASLRGHLTRWLIQPHAGLFVGHLSARVRELVWKRVVDSVGDGGATMIYPADTEQGFGIRCAGQMRRTLVDMEGLFLAKTLISR